VAVGSSASCVGERVSMREWRLEEVMESSPKRKILRVEDVIARNGCSESERVKGVPLLSHERISRPDPTG
jgi:hypothetical protein